MDLFRLALAAAIALPISYAGTPATARLAYRLGAIDRPDGVRKLHHRVTPRLGGLALLAAISPPLFFCFDSAIAPPLLAGGFLISAVGVCDDSHSLPPSVKLVCQSGVSLSAALLLAPPDATLAGLIFASVWICATLNAFNLIDGSDGLAAGQGALSGVLLAAFALSAGLSGELDMSLGGDLALASLALSAACLGFLPHNRARASVFLGDTGAMLIGCSVAILTLAFGARLMPIAALVSCALPMTELLSSVARRLARGSGLFCADRGHIHHRLADRGLSPKAIAIFAALASLAFGCLVLALYLLQNIA